MNAPLANVASAFLDSQRAALAERGASLGDAQLPTARDEAWRYTALRSIDRAHAVDVEAATRSVDLASLDLVDAPIRLVFVNGVHRGDLSRSSDVAGLRISIDRELPEPDSSNRDAFALLANAAAPRGLSIEVDAGTDISGPIAIVLVGAAGEAPVASHQRIRIRLAVAASASVVVQHVGGSRSNALANVSLSIALAKQAKLDVVRLQSAASGATIIERTHATLADSARLRHWCVEAGADLGRHELSVTLAGRDARFESSGAFKVAGRQHADTQLSVDHAARDTSCDLVWRGIADQRARGVFNGSIRVHAGADGTDARLQNKNLLLSQHAEIDTKPVLEILADEVKASHGATVGELDDTALFYLRSRGIPRDEARAVLTGAFAHVPFANAPAFARDAIARLLDRRWAS